MKLSKRLEAIAALVPRQSRLADIGTDHAYLPLFLLAKGIITFAVAGEVHNGPYQVAQDAIQQSGAEGEISLRLGDGLDVVAPQEVDVVVIAGMGGTTITGILAKRPEVTSSLQRVVLQPMNAAGAVRRWLQINGWVIDDETLVREDGRMYEIMTARQGVSGELEEILYDIGPVIWAKRLPLLKEHIEILLAQYKRVLQAMELSPGARDSTKFRHYSEKIKRLELSLACL